MRSPGFRTLLAAWTLSLVAAAVAAVLVIAHRQTTRLAGEEASARAERSAARAVEALAGGLDPRALERGTEVAIVVRSRAEIDAAFGDPRVALWRTALEGESVVRLVPGDLGAVAVRPVGAPPVAQVVEARVPGTAIAAPVRRFDLRALGAAAVVAAIALLASLLLARRLARPIVRLSAAAENLGRGDLETPLPTIVEGEAGRLALTLERMRTRLLETTGELERRRSELEAVLASVSEGVFAVDRDRKVRYFSPRAATLLGRAQADAVGRFCGDVLRPSEVAGERPCEVACPILQARFRGPVQAVERLQLETELRSVVLSSSPPSGGLQVQILREETAHEAARRARDAVVADLAHELRTPLAAQRASLELLRERLEDHDPENAGLLLRVEAGALRLQRLIDNLLESVRIEAGELAIRRQAVDLDEVVEEAVGTTAPLAAKRGQRIESELPYPLPRLLGDPQRLTQVLVNLLANASKYAPEESTIQVGGAVAEGEVRLWVEDPGPGFDPSELSRLAGRFRRGAVADGRSEPREEGSGLGLWIARSIAERHGGGLAVERVSGRTRVVLRLPASESAP